MGRSGRHGRGDAKRSPVPHWGESSYLFTRRQIGFHKGQPWVITVLREDEPLFLSGPKGVTSFSFGWHYGTSAYWFLRLLLARDSSKPWLVAVFLHPQDQCHALQDAEIVERFPTKHGAAERARGLQAQLPKIFNDRLA